MWRSSCVSIFTVDFKHCLLTNKYHMDWMQSCQAGRSYAVHRPVSSRLSQPPAHIQTSSSFKHHNIWESKNLTVHSVPTVTVHGSSQHTSKHWIHVISKCLCMHSALKLMPVEAIGYHKHIPMPISRPRCKLRANGKLFKPLVLGRWLLHRLDPGRTETWKPRERTANLSNHRLLPTTVSSLGLPLQVLHKLCRVDVLLWSDGTAKLKPSAMPPKSHTDTTREIPSSDQTWQWKMP